MPVIDGLEATRQIKTLNRMDIQMPAVNGNKATGGNLKKWCKVDS